LAWHPHIVTVFDAGDTPEGRPYLVMEYLPAGSLADRLRRDGPVPWAEAVAIGTKIAGALQVAHDEGSLHRDIKPDNVLVNRMGEPTLADFGIATLQDGTRTRSGVVTATLAYAAPEVIAGERASVVSDVYSLGAMVHALISGTAPFTRASDENIFAMMRRIDAEPPADLRAFGSPDHVATAVERAMAKAPMDRPASAAAFAELLTAALGDPQPAPAVPVTPAAAGQAPESPSMPSPAPPAGGGRRLLVAAVGAALLPGVGVAAWALTRDGGSGGEETHEAPSEIEDQFPDPDPGQALVVLGNGIAGDSGDGDIAVTALDNPWTIDVSETGLLMIADTGRNRARFVQDAYVTTVVGPPAEGDLAGPRGIVEGGDGALIADTEHNQVVQFGNDSSITVFAGTGVAGNEGDDGLATEAQLDNPHGLAVGPDGSVYIADTFNNRIRRVAPDGTIATVAGTGREGFSGDNGPAVDAELDEPVGIAVAPDGSLLVADTDNQRIRRVDPAGIITTIAGTGEEGFGGDGGPALAAMFAGPSDLVVAADGTIYVVDTYNHLIRRIGTDGTVTTVAGSGRTPSEDATTLLAAGAPLEMDLDQPRGLDLGPDGDLFIADSSNSRIVRVDAGAL
jgi:sugar lactone lactonase YvrE